LQDMNWALLEGEAVIGCNDAYLLGASVCPWCLYGDAKWREIHEHTSPGIRSYQGTLITCSDSQLHDEGWTKRLRRSVYRNGLTRERDSVVWNRNTGAAAINLAFHTGAARILLLGFDFALGASGQANWHVNLKDRPNGKVYASVFLPGFEAVAKDARKMWPSVEIINANAQSLLPCFPKMERGEALLRFRSRRA
jgi:hypothetical protein